MDISSILQAVSSVGFPIVIAAWFIITGHKATEANTEAIIKLSGIVDNNTKLIERITEKL